MWLSLPFLFIFELFDVIALFCKNLSFEFLSLSCSLPPSEDCTATQKKTPRLTFSESEQQQCCGDGGREGGRERKDQLQMKNNFYQCEIIGGDSNNVACIHSRLSISLTVWPTRHDVHIVFHSLIWPATYTVTVVSLCDIWLWFTAQQWLQANSQHYHANVATGADTFKFEIKFKWLSLVSLPRAEGTKEQLNTSTHSNIKSPFWIVEGKHGGKNTLGLTWELNLGCTVWYLLPVFTFCVNKKWAKKKCEIESTSILCLEHIVFSGRCLCYLLKDKRVMLSPASYCVSAPSGVWKPAASTCSARQTCI